MRRNLLDDETEVRAGDPVHAALEECAAAQRRVPTPSVRALPLRGVECHEPDLTEIPRLDESPQMIGDRLANVVLGDEQAPTERPPRAERRRRPTIA